MAADGAAEPAARLNSTAAPGDMSFGSYQITPEDAVANAVRFHKEAGVDAVKLEWGVRVAEVVRRIADSGMVVMGRLGLTPQSSSALGGFKAQGGPKRRPW